VELRISRDSVAAGDDIRSHDEVMDVDDLAPLADVVARILGRNYLAVIAGGEATWVLRAGRRGEAFGVVAQQWAAPKLLDPEVDIATVGPELHFDYQRQNDPQTVFDSLQA
jgi:hypothetical protein